MSQLKVNSISHPSGSSNNVTFDSSGNMTVGGSVVPSTPFMFRNRIINGDMRIDQRNVGASQTITAAAALAYTVDRWYAYCTGANVTGQRVTGAVANMYRYRFTGAASVTAIGFGQRIEAINCADLAGTTATLSVDMSNSLLTTVTWTAYYANTADTFGTLASPTRTQIASGTFTVTSSVARYSTEISIPSAATTGIEIVFTVGAQTSGTWVIGDCQLESGTVATPFERKLITAEQLLAYRYYYRILAGTGYTNCGTGRSYSTTNGQAFLAMPVSMRIKPVLAVSAFSDWNAAHTSGSITAMSVSEASADFRQVTIDITAGYVSGATVALNANNKLGVAWIDFNSEL